jgi:hypothetical protein
MICLSDGHRRYLPLCGYAGILKSAHAAQDSPAIFHSHDAIQTHHRL